MNIESVLLNNYDIKYSVLDTGDICIDGQNIDEILDIFNVEIVSKKYVSGRVVIEGYSSDIKDHFLLNNLRVNIQLSIYGDSIILGTPLIKGSF